MAAFIPHTVDPTELLVQALDIGSGFNVIHDRCGHILLTTQRIHVSTLLAIRHICPDLEQT